MRGQVFIFECAVLGGLLIAGSIHAHAFQFGDEEGATQDLGRKIVSLLEASEFAVGQYTKNSDSVDRNSKNPFGSDTTYHSYTWSYCLKWQTQTNCERWLDPYVALHGVEGGGDQSPLEAEMAQMWKDLKKDVDGTKAGSGNVQWGIWSVRSRGGAITKIQDNIRQKALDPEALADWRLLPEAEKKAEEIGSKTAEQSIRRMVEAENGEEDQTMPNMVKLRAGGAALTRAMRNRMLSSIGEARASQPGIEFELGEDRPTCEAYLQSYQQYEQQSKTPGAIPLPLRDMETRAMGDAQARYELCKKVTEARIYDVNPDVQGKEVGLGDPNKERIDAALNRINVAMIDQVGLDPNSQPKPEGVEIRKEDYTQTIANYEIGGAEYSESGETNWDQVQGYNENLREAAARMKAISTYDPDRIPDTSDKILEGQIEKGSKRLDQITGLTDQMKADLQGTAVEENAIFKTAGVKSSDPDDESIEIAPSQLTITTLGD